MRVARVAVTALPTAFGETGRLGRSRPGGPARAVGLTGRPWQGRRSMILERQSIDAAAGKGDFAMRSCNTSPVQEGGLPSRVPNLYPECHLSIHGLRG